MTRRGEGRATFQAEGKTWTLQFDFNALADFEAQTGKQAMASLQAMEEGDISAVDIRALFWAALQEHHPEVTLRAAGRLVEAGMDSFNAAVSSAFPPPAKIVESDEPGKAKAPA